MAAKVFAIPELLERILIELPIRDLLLSQRVGRHFKATIEGSTKLLQALFLLPAPQQCEAEAHVGPRVKLNPLIAQVTAALNPYPWQESPYHQAATYHYAAELRVELNITASDTHTASCMRMYLFQCSQSVRFEIQPTLHDTLAALKRRFGIAEIVMCNDTTYKDVWQTYGPKCEVQSALLQQEANRAPGTRAFRKKKLRGQCRKLMEGDLVPCWSVQFGMTIDGKKYAASDPASAS